MVKSKKKTKSKQKGSGIFTSSNNPIKSAKNTELELLDKYRLYLKSKIAYENSYNKHMKNLITIDEINQMGSSMVTVFNDIVFPNDIEGYVNFDLTNPLLIHSYLANKNTMGPDFRMEHIRQQVFYRISKLHQNDSSLFTNIKVEMESSKKVMISYIVLETRQFDRKVSINNNYILNEKEIDKQLKEIVSTIKADKTILLNKSKPIRFHNNPFLFKDETIYSPAFNSSVITNTKKLNGKLLGKSQNKTLKNQTQIKLLHPKQPEIMPKPADKEKNVPWKEYNNELEKQKKAFYGTPVEEPTGEDAPLTKKQILNFQHQQVIPVTNEFDEKGKPILAVTDITNDVREILGLEVKKQVKLPFNNDITPEQLKNMDLSQLSKENLDKICNKFSEDEETCKNIEQCWYNAKTNPKCYRFKTKNE
jgi:hypothetical protein